MANEPIPEKESENASYSINEGLSNMSKIISMSDNNSQYEFLQHVTSVKDKLSQGFSAEENTNVKNQSLAREGWSRPNLSNVPANHYAALNQRKSASSNLSPMDLYSGLNKDLALLQLRSSIMDKSLEFSGEDQSEINATDSSAHVKLNSLTTMSLEANRQNLEVEKIKDEIKRWNQMQANISFMDAMPGVHEAQPLMF